MTLIETLGLFGLLMSQNYYEFGPFHRLMKHSGTSKIHILFGMLLHMEVPLLLVGDSLHGYQT